MDSFAVGRAMQEAKEDKGNKVGKEVDVSSRFPWSISATTDSVPEPHESVAEDDASSATGR